LTVHNTDVITKNFLGVFAQLTFFSKTKDSNEIWKELRLVVLGDGGVGKSAFVVRYVQDMFVEDLDPTIEDSYRKLIFLGRKQIVLDILDTAEQDEWGRYRNRKYLTGHGYIILYSITSMRSFEQIDLEYESVLRAKDVDSFPMVIIVGTKTDLEAERQVPRAMGEEYAKKRGLNFFEVSSKADIGLKDVFLDISMLVTCGMGVKELFQKLEAGENILGPTIEKSNKCTIC
jgi:GTPase KRas protein